MRRASRGLLGVWADTPLPRACCWMLGVAWMLPSATTVADAPAIVPPAALAQRPLPGPARVSASTGLPVSPPPATAVPSVGGPAITPIPTPVKPTSGAVDPAPSSLFGSIHGMVENHQKRTAVYVETSSPVPAVPATERVTLGIQGADFLPQFLIVAVGQLVHVTNADNLNHSLFSVSPTKRMDLSELAAGESRTMLLDRPGLVDVFCAAHEGSPATILVVPTSLYARVSNEGGFLIGRVPVGSHRIIAMTPEGHRAFATVEVRMNQRTQVTLQFAIAERKP